MVRTVRAVRVVLVVVPAVPAVLGVLLEPGGGRVIRHSRSTEGSDGIAPRVSSSRGAIVPRASRSYWA